MTYVLNLRDNAPREALMSEPQIAAGEREARVHLVVLMDRDSGTCR